MTCGASVSNRSAVSTSQDATCPTVVASSSRWDGSIRLSDKRLCAKNRRSISPTTSLQSWTAIVTSACGGSPGGSPSSGATKRVRPSAGILRLASAYLPRKSRQLGQRSSFRPSNQISRPRKSSFSQSFCTLSPDKYPFGTYFSRRPFSGNRVHSNLFVVRNRREFRVTTSENPSGIVPGNLTTTLTPSRNDCSTVSTNPAGPGKSHILNEGALSSRADAVTG